EVRRVLGKYVLGNDTTAAGIPAIGKRPMGEVTRRELIALFDAIAEKHGGVMANRAMAWTARLFKWALGKAIIDASPVVDIEKPGEERKGARVLSDDEIREVWQAAGTLPFPCGHYVKALLLTGRRRTSVATMRRSEVDRTGRTWKPSDGTDNKLRPE